MLIVAVACLALAQDQVDNPEYKGWKAFKPGSSVTYKILSQGSEQKSTLKSIGESEAVLEVEFIKDGKSIGKMERKVSAKVPESGAASKEGPEEEIDVAGKKLKCRTRDFQKKAANGKIMSLRFWIYEEIPGGAAKMETTSEGGPKIVMIVSEWEKK
jgi:hypothetical protein